MRDAPFPDPHGDESVVLDLDRHVSRPDLMRGDVVRVAGEGLVADAAVVAGNSMRRSSRPQSRTTGTAP